MLITNRVLNHSNGTTTYIRELALGLKRRGHEVTIYTGQMGEMAKELLTQGIFVTRHLCKVPFVPTIIHGHHAEETTDAILFFKETPALFVCHDRVAWHDAPPPLRSIRRFVAVDDYCLERILDEKHVPQSRARVIYNFADLDRFEIRPPLPAKPQNALVFSNYATSSNYCSSIEKACLKLGIALDFIGSGKKQYTSSPECFLGNYDLVFAKAKCAIEALAIGCSVITCDFKGLGGMVTPANFDLMRRYNFGRKILTLTPTPPLIIEEIQKYSKEGATKVSSLIRAQNNLNVFLDAISTIYEEVLTSPIDDTIDSRGYLKKYRRRSVARELRRSVGQMRNWLPKRSLFKDIDP